VLLTPPCTRRCFQIRSDVIPIGDLHEEVLFGMVSPPVHRSLVIKAWQSVTVRTSELVVPFLDPIAEQASQRPPVK
jgi:hypothetical protein